MIDRTQINREKEEIKTSRLKKTLMIDRTQINQEKEEINSNLNSSLSLKSSKIIIKKVFLSLKKTQKILIQLIKKIQNSNEVKTFPKLKKESIKIDLVLKNKIEAQKDGLFKLFFIYFLIVLSCLDVRKI